MEGAGRTARTGGVFFFFTMSVDRAGEPRWRSGRDREIMTPRSGSAAICQRPYRRKYTQPNTFIRLVRERRAYTRTERERER